MIFENEKIYNGVTLQVYVARGSLSKVIGQKKSNKNRLIREYGFVDVKITEDESLVGYQFRIE